MEILSGEEVEQRLRQTSQLRSLALELRQAARAAWQAGLFPVEPDYDVREDSAYWKGLFETFKSGRPPE